MVKQDLIILGYLFASVLFILGLKGLTHPRTAVLGNLMGALGMAIAIGVTLLHPQLAASQTGYLIVAIGFLGGAIVGAIAALKVQMTAMPQMVALFNGFGGAASTLVAGVELLERSSYLSAGELSGIDPVVFSGLLAGFIGAVTFWGSLLAFAKLQEYKAFRKPFSYPFQHPLNAVLGVLSLGIFLWALSQPQRVQPYWLLVTVGSVLGLTLVNPIGGADMPVVIALLNSYSGLAACATGFVLSNAVLIIAGSLVGASGFILTAIMCRAMNRSLWHVLFGVLGPTEGTPKEEEVYGGKVKSATAEELAMLFDGARRVVIVPGYGLAVSQAQHALRDLMQVLESRGIEVEFAIHPVAGRMPGHMNVLLAEAEIPYEKLKELEDVNPRMAETDVAIVIGANDVVNPLAKTDPKSPIAGMPIVEVEKAKTVIVIKRSLSPGFAGIPNPLFAAPNCLMFFADGKKAVLDLVTAIKES
jgi:NAD(P) transhydrogenase subunit beta